MSARTRSLQALFAALLIVSLARAAAAQDALLFLEYMERGKRVSVQIVDASAPVRAPIKDWSEISRHVRQGTPKSGATMPPPRRVDFYQGEGGQRQFVFALEVRYFPAKDNKGDRHDKWLPHYRLHQELLFVRDGDQWRPLETMDGVPLVVDYSSPALPNIEGYYPQLDFGLTVGKLRIDAWQVVDATASSFSPAP